MLKLNNSFRDIHHLSCQQSECGRIMHWRVVCVCSGTFVNLWRNVEICVINFRQAIVDRDAQKRKEKAAEVCQSRVSVLAPVTNHNECSVVACLYSSSSSVLDRERL